MVIQTIIVLTSQIFSLEILFILSISYILNASKTKGRKGVSRLKKIHMLKVKETRVCCDSILAKTP